MQRRSWIGRVVLLCAGFGASTAFAVSVDELRANVEASRSAAAWEQCATIDRVTMPAADLWCGIAAVDTGHAGEGVLALERYSTARAPKLANAAVDAAVDARKNARATSETGDNTRALVIFLQPFYDGPGAARTS